MGRVIASKIKGMSWWAKGSLVVTITLLCSIFMQRGWFEPVVSDSATATYKFYADPTGAGVNVGADGTTSATTWASSTSYAAGNKYSLSVSSFTTTGYIPSGTVANVATTMASLYGPVYTADTVLSAPVMNLAIRSGASNTANWTVNVYDYNPGGAANNGILLWSGTASSTSSTTASKAVSFSSTTAATITHGHRVKVVVTATPTVASSAARLYFYSATNVYSSLSMSETIPVNTTQITNLTDYNNGNITAVDQGQQNVPMLSFQLASNSSNATNWTGGKLDLTGSQNLSDVTFTIYKSNSSSGIFNPATDTKIADNIAFTQAAGQPYTLATPQSVTSTPQRYFVVFNVSSLATANDTAGVNIADSSYFTVDAGNVDPMLSGASSTLSISAANAATLKTYLADFDSGTALTSPLTGNTTTACQASSSNISGTVTGLLNYPNHSCTVAGATNYLGFGSAATVNLYFNGPSYASDTTVTGAFFNFYAVATSGTPTTTVTLFYVDKNGATTYANGGVGVAQNLSTTGTTYNLNLSSQVFASSVPKGARLGVRIAVGAGTRLTINKAAGSKLQVYENPVSVPGVDVTDGKVISNSSVSAGTTGVAVDAFAMSASTARSVSSLTVTGNSTTTAANVSKVYIYRKVGSNLAGLEGSDLLIGSGNLSGNSVTINLATSEAVGSTLTNYLVVYDITSGATVGQTLTGTVSAISADLTDLVADTTSATITLVANTTITEAGSEPASITVPASAGATPVDAFGLYTNNSAADALQTVTVQLASGTSAAVAQVDIVDVTNSKVYSSTAPISGDTWRVPVSGLFATSSTTQCQVRITPKSDAAGTYYVTALVTGITHTENSNILYVKDAASATVTIDAYAPPNSSLQASSGSARDTVNLSWIPVTDSNRNAPAVSYKLVRGAANNPAPADCSGTALYSGSSLSFLDGTGTGGNSYGYRLCSVDSVGNTSVGAIATATAKLPKSCNQTPGLSFVSSNNQYAKTGDQVEYVVNILNNDVGACSPVTYSLSLSGTPNAASFETPTFPATVTVGPGGGANVSIKIKSTPAAVQGDNETLTLNLAASSQASEIAGPGYAMSSKPIVTAVNNFGPMLHSSFSVGTTYGTWGTTSTCNDCHIGTNESTKNIKLIRQMVTTPTGLRPVTFNRLSSTTASSGTLGNDLRADNTSSANICEVCHHQTKFHEYSAVSSRTQLAHNNGADCMRCHPHKGGFKAVGAADCVTCHGNPPTSRIQMASPATNALGNSPTDWGAHQRHNDLKMGCTVCHNGYTSDPMGNKVIELGFSVRSSNYQGFTGAVSGGNILVSSNINTYYSWNATSPGTTLSYSSDQTEPTCTVYCHGGWTGGGGTNNTPAWVGQNQAACGTCHNVSNANPPTTGSHMKHAYNGNFLENQVINGVIVSTVGGLNISCDKCHGALSNYSSARHVNGKVEWDLSGISAGATYNGKNKGDTGNPALGTGFGSCTNLYCHSTVQPDGGVGGPTYQSATWGATATCGSCHVDMYTSPAATGGHKQHAQASGSFATPFDCRICHANGGSTNPQNHANGTIDINFSGYGANTVYSAGSHAPGAGYGSCSTSNCHGRSTRTWGPSSALTLCDKCHGSQTSAGGFYSTTGPTVVLGNTDPHVGAHNAHIHNPNSSFSLYTSYSMAKDCSECHIKPTGPYDAGHIDTPLPAEVTFLTGKIANKAVDNGVPGALPPSYDPNSGSCSNVWCHGYGMDSNMGNGAYATVAADGGTLHTQVNPTWNDPSLLTGVPANDCTRCHSYPPPGPNQNYTHFSHFSSNGKAVLKKPTECNNCHIQVKTDGSGFINSATHINGVLDKGCQACHGVPPTTTAGLAFTADGALAPGQAGAHLAHASIPAIGKTCTTCHYNYSTTSMPNNVLEMGFNAMGGQVSSGTFWGYTSMNNGLTVYSSTGAGTTVRQTSVVADQNTCMVYCHGNTIGGGSLAKPQWDSGAHQVCGNCHGVNVAYLNTTSLPAKGAPTTSSHPKHSATTGYNITCDVCHGVINNNAHVDGNVTWNLATSDPRVGAGANYKGAATGGTGKIALGAAYGSCNNIYCHSDGTSLSAPSYQSQAWGAGTLSCNACHSDMGITNSTATGSHLRHVQAGVGNYTCIQCHGAGYATSGGITATTHVDMMVNVAVSYSKGSSFVAGGPSAYGTCSNTVCHGRGTPAWGANLGSVSCEKCHADGNSTTFYATSGNTATSDPHAGAHQGHLKASTGYALALTCDTCHPTRALKDAGHMNGTVEFNTANITSYDPVAGTCVTWCHGAGMDAQHIGSATSPKWSDAATYLTGTPSTAECGKCHAFPPSNSAHSTATATFASCNICHPEVNATTGKMDKPQLHLNGAADVTPKPGQDCAMCHNSTATPLASMVNDPTTYHHVLTSTANSYTGNTCLKCHVDHDLSDPDFNTGNTSGVGFNLRVDNSVTAPLTGAAPSNADGGYTNTDFISSATKGGICTSCHMTAMGKNLTGQQYQSPFINTTTMVVTKAQYAGTMHNYTTTSTFASTFATAPTKSVFVANCVKCHSDTMSENRQTGTVGNVPKTFGLHLSSTRELFGTLGASSTNDAREDRLCFGCHNNGETINMVGTKVDPTRDWYGSRVMNAVSRDTFNSFTSATRVFRHNVGKYNGLHKPNQNLAYSQQYKEVECADCHNGHVATFGNHSSTAPGTAKGSRANTLAGSLQGATGVTVTTWGAASPTTAWMANPNTYGQSPTQALPVATQEYQICYKCHSKASGGTGWFKNMTSATSMGGKNLTWTDLAVEFNPNNASRHPIGTPLTATKLLTTSGTNAPKLNNGWTPGSVMTCTDCHATDSTASKGPHGSSVKWMLAGTNKAWPYTSAAMNGGLGNATLTSIYYVGNATDPTKVGTVDGLFCLNCHTVRGTNAFHIQVASWGATGHSSWTYNGCVICHIRVPHGGKISRLLSTVSAPSRYRPDGNGAATYFSAWGTMGNNTTDTTSGRWSGSCGTHSGGTESW